MSWRRRVLPTVCAGDVIETSFLSEVRFFFMRQDPDIGCLQTTPNKLVGLYSSFIPVAYRTCFVHTHYDSPHIHPSIMHSMSSMPHPFYLLSNFTRPPLIITPHTRTPLPSTLTSAQVLPCRYIFPTPLFLAYLCSPRFCVSSFFIFCPAT